MFEIFPFQYSTEILTICLWARLLRMGIFKRRPWVVVSIVCDFLRSFVCLILLFFVNVFDY